MIRCRQCNSKLPEQAHFCNVCGLPQKHEELESEKCTYNGAQALGMKSSTQCESCGAAIPREARFCALCVTAQSFKKEVVVEQSPNVVETCGSKMNGHDDLTVGLQPSVADKPAQHATTIPRPLSKEAYNATSRPITPKSFS